MLSHEGTVALAALRKLRARRPCHKDCDRCQNPGCVSIR
jgi:hypothetical protein